MQALVMSDAHAAQLGFPAPLHPDLVVLDNVGRLWRWVPGPNDGLGNLAGLWQSLIAVGGGVGAKLVPALMGGGPVGAAIGAGIGLVSTILSAIFGGHAAKVQREDQVSSAWASQGPAAISAIMQAYQTGQISGSDAISGLQQIEQQFVQMAAPISKYNGTFGALPDPNGPRPSSNCNWACGTYWDLHQELKGHIAQIQSGGTGSVLGSLGSSPVLLIGLVVLGFLALK